MDINIYIYIYSKEFIGSIHTLLGGRSVYINIYIYNGFIYIYGASEEGR